MITNDNALIDGSNVDGGGSGPNSSDGLIRPPPPPWRLSSL
jgi:hypothetical protein